MKINLKIIIVLQILLVSCVNSAQQMQDREEEELRKKMMELKHGLNDMQKEINQEMKEMDSLQKSLDSFPLK